MKSIIIIASLASLAGTLKGGRSLRSPSYPIIKTREASLPQEGGLPYSPDRLPKGSYTVQNIAYIEINDPDVSSQGLEVKEETDSKTYDINWGILAPKLKDYHYVTLSYDIRNLDRGDGVNAKNYEFSIEDDETEENFNGETDLDTLRIKKRRFYTNDDLKLEPSTFYNFFGTKEERRKRRFTLTINKDNPAYDDEEYATIGIYGYNLKAPELTLDNYNPDNLTDQKRERSPLLEETSFTNGSSFLAGNITSTSHGGGFPHGGQKYKEYTIDRAGIIRVGRQDQYEFLALSLSTDRLLQSNSALILDITRSGHSVDSKWIQDHTFTQNEKRKINTSVDTLSLFATAEEWSHIKISLKIAEDHPSYNNSDKKIKLTRYRLLNRLRDGGTKDIYVDLEDAPDIDTLLSQISAKDLFGVDLPIQCSPEERSKYKKDIVGVYTVKITATDAYSQHASATLKIHVVDKTPPKITLREDITELKYSYKAELNHRTLESFFTAEDTGGFLSSVSRSILFTVDGVPLKNLVASPEDNRPDAQLNLPLSPSFVHKDHTVHVEIADKAGNVGKADFPLKVSDPIAPVLSRKDGQPLSSPIKVGLSKLLEKPSPSLFASFYQAIDEVDGELQLDVDLSHLEAKVGSYPLTLKATDKSNNTASQEVTLEVVKDLPPVFILSDTLILASVDHPLTKDALSQIVKERFSSYSLSKISLEAPTYFGKEDTPGDHTVFFSVSYPDSEGKEETKNGTFTLKVMPSQSYQEDQPSKKEKWYTPIVRFFEKLKNWFIGVFTKWRFDCFITDIQWKERFSK